VTALMRSLRKLVQSWRLSLGVMLCTAIGVAAFSAVIALIELTNFRALPFKDSQRLVRIWNEEPGVETRGEVTFPDYLDLSGQLNSLEELQAITRSRLIFVTEGGARRVEGESVTRGYFEMLGAQPIIGRLFSPQEYEPSAPDEIVISYQTWGRMFNYDPSVLGRTLRTTTQNDSLSRQYEVIGVMPQSFIGTTEEDFPDLEFWLPVRHYLSEASQQARNIQNTLLLGKLRQGASLSAARQELAALDDSLRQRHPEARENLRFRLEPMGDNWRANFRDSESALLLAAGLLLLVAVINVAALLSVRSAERRGEFAIRQALGAGRGRIAVGVALETMLLIGAGGVLGVLCAPRLLHFFLGSKAAMAEGSLFPGYLDISLSPLSVSVAAAVILACGLGAAVVPALGGMNVRPGAALRDAGRVVTNSRLMRFGFGLVIAELALTVMLVTASGLLIRSHERLDHADLGFRTGGMLRFGLFVNAADVPEDEALPGFYRRVRETVLQQPGVRGAALVWPTVPLPSAPTARVHNPMLPPGEQQEGVRTSFFYVDTSFFELFGIPSIAGRVFTDGDDAGSDRVAVISNSLAERLGGPQHALGQTVTLSDQLQARVVGVVGDTRFGGARESEQQAHEFYMPLLQSPRRLVSVEARVAGDPDAYFQSLRQRLAAIAPNSAVDWTDSFDYFIGWLNRDSLFQTLLVSVYTACALALAVIGLYAVLSNLVARSTKEIGIRMSLGATAGAVLGLVIRRGLALAVIGLGIGLLLSVAVGYLIRSLLYGVAPIDPFSIGAGVAVMFVVALLASSLPGIRAARVHPMQALRDE